MEPITLSIVSGILYIAYDRYQKKKAQPGTRPSQIRGATGVPSPDPGRFELPPIGAAETETFTSVISGVRQFDKAACSGLPFYLQNYSAVPIPSGPIAEVAPQARVFRVMPPAPGAIVASDIVKHAHTAGQTVLASLTLIGLPSGWQAPMVIVVGGPELRPLVASAPGQQSAFAILAPTSSLQPTAPVAAPVAVAPAPAAKEEVVKVVAEVQGVPTSIKKATKPNGLKDEAAPPAVIVTEGEVKA